MNWQSVLSRCHAGKVPLGRQSAHDLAAELNAARRLGERPLGPYRCPVHYGESPHYHVGHVPSLKGLQSIADAIRARHQECAA